MGVGNRIADSLEQLKTRPDRQLFPRGKRRQRNARDQLHGKERSPVGRAPGLMDGGNAGVPEPPQDARLAAKHAFDSAVGSEARMKDLDGDAPARVGLLGFIDDAHASAADLANDAVVADEFRHRAGGFARIGARHDRAHRRDQSQVLLHFAQQFPARITLGDVTVNPARALGVQAPVGVEFEFGDIRAIRRHADRIRCVSRRSPVHFAVRGFASEFDAWHCR